MRNRFFWKIVALSTGIAALFGLFTLWVSYIDIRSAWIDASVSHLRSLCVSVEGQVAPLLDAGREAEVDALAKRLGRELAARITIVLPGGRVVADTERDPGTMDSHSDRTEVAAALKLGSGSAVRHSHTLHEDRVYVALRIPGHGSLQAVIRASLPLEEANRLAARLFWKIALSAGVVLVFVFLAVLWFSRRLVKPVQQLVQAAENLAEGNFDARVDLPGQGEMSELASAFNAMAGHVQKLFTEVSQRKEQLEMLVSSIHEGLAVIGKDNRILRANAAFWTLLGLKDREGIGKPFWESVRDAEFADALRRSQENTDTVTCEVTMENRVCLCSLTPLRLENSTAALLVDVTERKRVENLQKELVINFSHEFKTPLTAVRGYAETIEDEASDESTREFAAIIRRNAERLQHITEDLLMLARLDRKEMAFKPEPVNLADAFASVGALYRPAMAEKGLGLKVTVPPGLPPVMADPFLLEQVFVNLFDNAVRHTAKGGITVTCTRQGNLAEIRFADTGEGISPEHLGRIFDRFYVVDASRSRRKDGTGLGLAIVRTIVLRHGGEIAVESRSGEGAMFRIALPLSRNRRESS